MSVLMEPVRGMSGVERTNRSRYRKKRTIEDERTKVSRACDACKSKKIRCSGTQPCLRCSRLGDSCTYHSRYCRGRPPTPQPLGLHNPESGSPLRKTTSPHTESVSIENHLPTPDPSHFRTHLTSEPPIGGASRTSPEPGVGSEIEGVYFGPTSGLTFLDRAFRRLVNESGQLPSLGTTSLGAGESIFNVGDRPFPKADSSQIYELPTLEDGLELIRVYFETAIATYRFLHRPTIEDHFRSLCHSGFQSDPFACGGPAARSTIFFVLAMASFHRDYSHNHEAGMVIPAWTASERYFLAAESELSLETGRPSLESVQARLVKCVYLLSTARTTQAWYCFGTIFQIATSIGLHRKATNVRNNRAASSEDYIRAQFFRRAFWTTYIIDKYLSVILGRPRYLHDDDYDQQEPDCVDDEDMTRDGPIGALGDCSVDALVHHARLAKLVGMTSKELYSLKSRPMQERILVVQSLSDELQEWRESLPAFLSKVKPSSLIPMFRRQSNCLRLAYAHATIHLHRHFLLQPSHRFTQAYNDWKVVRYGVEQCMTAAQEALEIFDSIARTEPAFYAFWWSQYVAFCAVVVVYVARLQSLRRAASVVNPDDVQVVLGAESLFHLAERCEGHLAICTRPPLPNRRYGLILEELQHQLRRHMELHSARVSRENNNDLEARDRVAGLTEDIQTLEGAIPLGNLDIGSSPNDPMFGWEPADWLELDSWAFGTLPDNMEV